MVKKRESQQKSNSSDDKILFAFLATFLSIIGFFIAIFTKRDDKYVMFYAKQSLVIFIISLIAGLIDELVAGIPIMGTIIYVALGMIIIIIWILSWVHALTGKEKRMPIISSLSEKFNF